MELGVAGRKGVSEEPKTVERAVATATRAALQLKLIG